MLPTERKAWKKLETLTNESGNRHLAQLFGDDERRFKAFSLREGDLLLDYSKQRVTRKTIEALCQLARECDLNGWIERMFSGERINSSDWQTAR